MNPTTPLQHEIESTLATRVPDVEVVLAERTSPNQVRVVIDRPGGVDLDLCERVSRELSPLRERYALEVSSPGLDRPLRTAAHFQRYSGETAKVTLAEPLEGRKNFKGVVKGVEPPGPDATLVVIDVDGAEFRLPIQSIASARLVPDWDSVMKTHKEAK